MFAAANVGIEIVKHIMILMQLYIQGTVLVVLKILGLLVFLYLL